MQDEEITLFNTCTDLVSLKAAEGFPLHLFQSNRPGDWVCVREVCERIGVTPGDLKPKIFATWLPDPMAHDGYAVIVFYDDDLKWSMAAHYNRARLLDGERPKQALRTIGSAVASIPCSIPQQPTPAAER